MPHLMQNMQLTQDGRRSEENFQEKFDELYKEIGRLNRELDRAISENVQSAKCGLALLEEKSDYEKKCVHLEVMYDHTRQELEAAQQALRKLTASQKITNENGIEQETNLLNESAAMESSFTIQVQELENEVKQLRRELERVAEERDHYSQELADLAQLKSKLEVEKMQLRKALKELKQSEAKTANKNSELEEKNYALQRELSRLQTIQTELKTSKSEINRLLEENLHLHEQIELLRLQKQITEARLDEITEELEIEREANRTLRKDAEGFGSKGLMLKTRSLADSILEIKDIGSSVGSLLTTSRSESTNSSVGNTELFQQVINELKQIRQQLEELESVGRSNAMIGAVCNPESEHNFLKPKMSTIIAGDDGGNHPGKQMENGGGGCLLEDNKELKEILYDKILNSDADLSGQHKIFIADNMHIMHNEVLALKEKLREFATNSSRSTFNYISETTSENLVITQNTLITLNEQLLRFREQIYAIDGQSSMCKLFKELNGSDTIMNVEEEIFSASPLTSGTELLLKSSNLKKQAVLAQFRFGIVETVLHHLMGSMKNVFSMKKNSNNLEAKLVKRVDKLEKLLSKKQRDIATLQTIIKSNKTTAKEILANIRKKYDEEKTVVNETILKLTCELMALKDETAVLSGLRKKFMSRCTQYYSNAVGLAFELDVAEEEKELLKKILKISINSKVDLQQRLEAMKKNLQGINSDIPKRKKCVQFSSRTVVYE